MRAVRFGSRVRVSPRVTALAAVTAMVGITAVTTAASAATGGAALRGPGSHWAQVTPNGQLNFADPGLAVGAHGTLNVIWSSGQTSGGHGTVHDTTVSARGVVGHTVTVRAGQYLTPTRTPSWSGSGSTPSGTETRARVRRVRTARS